MLPFIWIGIVLTVLLALFLIVKQKRLKTLRNRENLPSSPNLFNLQIGDIVQYLGDDWVVEGKLTYDDEGYIWFEYMLQDGERLRWLSVEEDDLVEVTWLEPVNTLEFSGTPPQQLTWAGEFYRCVDSGIAKMSRVGTIQRRQAEECRYYDYEGAEGKFLSLEDWGGEIEVTVGQRIRPSSLSFLPGSGNSVYRV